MSQNRGGGGEPDLSFIQPDVNLKDVSRLEMKKVIHTTNEFLLRIADISNSFMQKMETKIFEIEKNIDTLDTVLTLVETKLENVKPNTDVIQQKEEEKTEQSKEVETSEQHITVDTITPPDAPVISTTAKAEIIEFPLAETPKVDEGKIKISEHPNFSKYFKMLRLGIPEAGVKQKMASEGIDASLLDNPNALVDALKPQDSEDSDSDSSFSSSD